MTTPMDVTRRCPVRKSRQQKEAFRREVTSWLQNLGYEVHTENGSFGSRNLVIGNPQAAKFLVTAHYDTCARLPFPNLITPCNFWLFLLYQLFVCALLLVPAGAVGGLAGYALHRPELGHLLFQILLWTEILLMLIGPANPTNANDNTSGVVTLLELAGSLPPESRKNVCFILFDLEEAGLIGSSSYQSKHKKETVRQLVLNLDCVGEGDEIYLFPTEKLKKNPKMLLSLENLRGNFGKKSVALRSKGFSFYPSDQMNFPYGVGICALNRCKTGLYLSRIHTPRDTILDETNVITLCRLLESLISGSTAQ